MAKGAPNLSAAFSKASDGKRSARNIRDEESTKKVSKGSSNIEELSGGEIDDDGIKYSYAVNLAKQDMGDDIDTDSQEFRDLVDSYYEQQDPTMSAADIRGETGIGNAIRMLGDGVDDVNDLLGDGVKGVWDFFAGGVGDIAGNIAEHAFGVEDAGDEWGDAARGLVSDDTADALASIGTGLAVSAIPGIGVPLSAGLGLVQNSDDIYEAITGRDDTTLEKLSDEQRIAKGALASLDTILSVAPGVGKLRNAVKGATYADDVADATKILGESDDLAKAAGKLYKAGDIKGGDELFKQSADALGGRGASIEDIAQAIALDKEGAGTSAIDALRAYGNVVADAPRSQAAGIKATVKDFVQGGPVKPSVGDDAGALKILGDYLGTPKRRVSRALEAGRDARAGTDVAMGSRIAQGQADARSGMNTILGGAKGKATAKAADAIADSSREGGARNAVSRFLSNRNAKRAANAVEGKPTTMRQRIAGATPNTVANFAASVPMNMLSYVAATGDTDPFNAIDSLSGDQLLSNLIISAAPGAGRLSRRLGLANISGASPRPTGRTGSSMAATQRALAGYNQDSYREDDEPMSYEEFIERINQYGGE